MKTEFLEQGAGKIAYDVTGSGPLAVCAPSMGDVRAEYRFLAPKLVEAGWRVATMDLRGLGESSVGWDDYSVAGVGSDILALIRRLGGPAARTSPAVVIADSMAGGAAVWAAAQAPELLRALVLIDPFVRDFPGWMNRLYPLMFADVWGASMWTTYYASLYPGRKPADFTAYRAALAANLHEPGRMRALRQMLYASKAASEAALAGVKAPTLVVMGTRDPDFKDPAGEAQWIAERVRGTVRLIEGAGHYPHAELPEATAAVILPFLTAQRGPAQAQAAGDVA